MNQSEDKRLFGGIRKSTWQLLRFPFSFFLMPIFWFALSQVPHRNWPRAVLVFLLLHVLLYPASNGYNSYMDKDQSSIGGLKHPLQPTRQLFWISAGMDLLAMSLGLLISPVFCLGITGYILASRAYSYRGIRLKKYPVLGYVTVILCQGALIFFLVYHGVSVNRSTHVPASALIASSLLVGGFYPLTQVYQQAEDLKDGVRTISTLLGTRGTFLFSMAVYTLAFLALTYHFLSSLEEKELLVMATTMMPVLVYFLIWAARVWKNEKAADFGHTMKMNILASCCTNLGFLVVLVMQ